MSCEPCDAPCNAPYDLRDYFFEELSAEAREQMRVHVEHCADCVLELDRLRATALCLTAQPDEEIPRRLAFVSDKIFEQSSVVRWWQAFSLSGLRFAGSAALILAGAIVFHAYHQPAPVASAQMRMAESESAKFTPAETQAAIDRAVAKAVAASEDRYQAKLERAAAANKAQIREYMERTQDTLDAMDRRSRVLTVASNRNFEAGQ